MEKSRAIELLEHLAWDRDIEGNPYGDALNMAIKALKAQLSQEGTTSDLISKTETAEHLRRVLDATVPVSDYDEGYVDGVEFGISTVSTMPTVQPVATDANVGDTISRQAVLDAVEKNACNTQRIMDAVNNLPPAQPEPAIPLSWIEKYIEWLKGLDNEFVNLAAAHISVMVKKWRDEPNARTD